MRAQPMTDRVTEHQARRKAELEALDWRQEGGHQGTIKMVSPSGRLACYLGPVHSDYQEIRT